MDMGPERGELDVKLLVVYSLCHPLLSGDLVLLQETLRPNKLPYLPGHLLLE